MNTITSTHEEARAFLQAFYRGDGNNQIAYERAFDRSTEREGYQRIQRWAAPLLTGEPAVLLRNRDGGAVWYGVARSERGVSRLGEELVAFVGPSISDVILDRASLDADDPIESAISSFSRGHTLRFRGDDKAVAEAVDRLFRVRERKQYRAPTPTRSVGLVLRNFHMALVAGLPDEADVALRELRERALLSPLNLHFLRVQALSSFGRWSDLVGDDPLVPLGRLLAIRRPSAVTEALIQAVYHQYLARLEKSPEEQVEVFTSTVTPRFSALFIARGGLHSVEVLRSFMALAVASEDVDLRDDVEWAAQQADIVDPVLTDLASLVKGQSQEGATLEDAEAAAIEGDYGRAYQMARPLDDSTRKAQLLLRCAFETQSNEIEAAAVTSVQSLGEIERATVLRSRFAREIYQDLTGDEGEAEDSSGGVGVPATWTDWIQAVLSGSIPHARALSVADTGSHEWSVGSLLQDPDGPSRLGDALEDGITRVGVWETVQQALPYLVGSLRRDPLYPRPALFGLYRRILGCIAATTSPGDADLVAFTDLSSAVLQGPLDEETYRSLVNDSIVLWERAESIRRLDWLLDVLESLSVHTVLNENARLRLLTIAADAFRRYRERVTEVQLELLFGLADEAGHPETVQDLTPPPKEEGRVDPYSALAGLRVAIYTLDERAGARVQAHLAERCPDARIDLVHDIVCTERIKTLARAADVFVIAAGSATHAATDCIGQYYDGRPVYPNGKGSASMLTALREWIGSL